MTVKPSGDADGIVSHFGQRELARGGKSVNEASSVGDGRASARSISKSVPESDTDLRTCKFTKERS